MAGRWRGVVGAVVVERDDGGVGGGYVAGVVLEVEFVVHREGGGFAAELPDDGAVEAADFEDGFYVAAGDEVVAVGVFVYRIDVACWLSAKGIALTRRQTHK